MANSLSQQSARNRPGRDLTPREKRVRAKQRQANAVADADTQLKSKRTKRSKK